MDCWIAFQALSSEAVCEALAILLIDLETEGFSTRIKFRNSGREREDKDGAGSKITADVWKLSVSKLETDAAKPA